MLPKNNCANCKSCISVGFAFWPKYKCIDLGVHVKANGICDLWKPNAPLKYNYHLTGAEEAKDDD